MSFVHGECLLLDIIELSFPLTVLSKVYWNYLLLLFKTQVQGNIRSSFLLMPHMMMPFGRLCSTTFGGDHGALLINISFYFICFIDKEWSLLFGQPLDLSHVHLLLFTLQLFIWSLMANLFNMRDLFELVPFLLFSY